MRVAETRDRLTAALKAHFSGVHEFGDVARRLPNTANIRFEGADAEAVVTNMDPVAVSTGSACGSGSLEPSELLLAMGIPRDVAFENSGGQRVMPPFIPHAGYLAPSPAVLATAGSSVSSTSSNSHPGSPRLRPSPPQSGLSSWRRRNSGKRTC